MQPQLAPWVSWYWGFHVESCPSSQRPLFGLSIYGAYVFVACCFENKYIYRRLWYTPRIQNLIIGHPYSVLSCRYRNLVFCCVLLTSIDRIDKKLGCEGTCRNAFKVATAARFCSVHRRKNKFVKFRKQPPNKYYLSNTDC